MEAFNEEFCDTLNWYLMDAMEYRHDKLAHSCSMDGVLMPFIDRQLYKKSVNDTRKIQTTAWALSDWGDILFELTVYFGKYSLRRYARGSRLDDCLPPLEQTPTYVEFDLENRKIELRLF